MPRNSFRGLRPALISAIITAPFAVLIRTRIGVLLMTMAPPPESLNPPADEGNLPADGDVAVDLGEIAKYNQDLPRSRAPRKAPARKTASQAAQQAVVDEPPPTPEPEIFPFDASDDLPFATFTPAQGEPPASVLPDAGAIKPRRAQSEPWPGLAMAIALDYLGALGGELVSAQMID